MAFALPFPAIDPVLIEFGPFAVRWYALAYIGGLVLGWRYVRRLARLEPAVMNAAEVDDLLVWATLGVILGGRIGYVLFYNPGHYLANPASALAVWQGGMSFHGGMLGVVAALVLFARRRRLPLLGIADRVACATPIGLFLGRLANFVNGELFGRTTDVAWAVVFPRGGSASRHPSQLYEAVLEGVVLLVLLYGLVRLDEVRARAGALAGVFLAGYGVVRIAAEVFREPDPQLGFLLGGATMGQLLSVPMIIAGLFLVWIVRRPGAA